MKSSRKKSENILKYQCSPGPDLLCLVAAKESESILLSENIGVIRVCEFHPDYVNIKVMTSLDLIEQLVYENEIRVSSISNFLDEIKLYERETGHKFSKKRLEECVKRVENSFL
ncbi:MAG: hypothetical protein ACE5J9_09350 [Methanosarcinales archaeon]